MSSIEGGDFMTGFASGAASSLVSSGMKASVGRGGMVKTPNDGYQFAKVTNFGQSEMFKAVMIASGGLSGGISSTIAGGNFWKGMSQGLITSGLNAAAHWVVGDPPGGKKPKVIDNTKDAVDNYYYGDGSPVELGPDTKKALLNDPDYKRVLTALKDRSANQRSYNFRVNLTQEIFHVGKTRVNYSTSCSTTNCATNFSAFVGDGFRDPLDMENLIGVGIEIPLPVRYNGLPTYLLPKPYNYIPYNFSVTYPNPGYPVGTNIK